MGAAGAAALRVCHPQPSAPLNRLTMAAHQPDTSSRVPALDLFRAAAAALMVLNHAGFALMGRDAAVQGASGLVVFLGSFAPVLFFFATGWGAGLRDRRSTKPLGDVLDKALLLALADQFLHWRIGRPLGLDFFAFIGVSL